MMDRRTKGWRRWALWIGGGLAAFVLAIAALWQTGLLNRPVLWAAGEVSGYRLTCGKLEGGLLSKFTCTDLTLADAKGRFLTAGTFTLGWNPWALLSNTVAIHSLGLTDAKLTRMPGSSSSASSSGGFLPGTKIAIADLRAQHLVLALPSAPEACVSLALKGHIGPEGFAAGLGLVRCAPKNGQMTFRGTYVKKTGALQLTAEGHDNGALAAALTGVGAAGATRVTLQAGGTLSAFNGKFTLASDNLATIDASFTARDLTATSLNARFNIVPALLPRWAPRGPGTASADVTRGPNGSFDISAFSLDWNGVKGAGHLALNADNTLNGALRLDTTRSFTISGASIGALKAEVAIAGIKTAPSLRGTAVLSDVTSGSVSLATLRANFAGSRGGHGIVAADLAGHADGARLPAPAAGLVGTAFDFHATGKRTASGVLAVDATLDGQAARLVATAELGTKNGRGDATLTVPDLAKADAGFGGSAKAVLHLTRLTLGGDLGGTLAVSGTKVTATGLGKALGASPSFRADLRVAGKSYGLDNVTLDTAAIAAQGSAHLAADGKLAAGLKTTRGDLAPFSDVLGRKLRGKFSLTAAVSGPRKAPAVMLRAEAPRLAIDNNIARNTVINLDARKAGPWTGRLTATSKTSAGPIDVAADVARTDGGWQVEVTKGALGPAMLSGRLAKRGDIYNGALRLKGELLAPAGFLLGQPMQGRGTLALRGERGTLHLTADLTHVAAGPLHDASFKADATLGGPKGTLGAKLDVADGKNTLSTTVEATLTPLAVTMKRLAGRWSGADFALTKPATFAKTPGGFTLAPANISIAGGTLTVAATGDSKRLDASAHLVKMPVAPLATIMRLGKASGTLGIDLTAQMAPGSTRAEFKLAAQGLLFAGAGKKDKPANVNVTANWNGDVVALDGRISGLDAKDATLTARVPVVRAANGYLPKLAQSGPVSAQLRAQLQAGRLFALLPLAEENVTGQLTAAADVTGDIAAPQLSGKIALADGSFTDYETGTTLTKVKATLDATGGSRAALKLTAYDGNSGTVKAEGEFSMSALETGGAGKLAGHLDVDLKDAEVLREDLAHASLTGHVGVDLAGDQPGAITGTLRTNTVRVDLGAAIPPDIPQIEVTEINAGTQPVKIARQAPSLFGKASLDVDITMPNRVYVTGHGTDSEWSGNLKVAGTVASPDVSGKLSLIRGQAELIGKSFTLQQGTVQIANSIPGGASLNIVGQNESSDITVTVKIDGPVTKPDLSWSSSPALPRSEILSRLFFGTSSPHLSVGQAFQLAQLTGQLDRFGLGSASSGGGILGFARKLTGLDVLRVSAPSDLNGTGAAVTAGKYVSDRVYVGVKQGANISAGTAEVQVKITPHITLDAEAGANSQGSAGVSWKWDY